MSNNEIKYIDLFAGAGGLSLGLYNAGLKGIFAIEKNKDAFETLKYNLINAKKHFNWCDWFPITEHLIEEVVVKYKKELMKLRGKVDLVVGGPPCQGFSMAGKREHTDVRNTMVNYYIEIIKLVKPKYLFLENVHGFTVEFKDDSKKKPYSVLLKEELKKLGYNLKSDELFMDKYGIPQHRKRFILVGSLKNNIEDFFLKLEKNTEGFLASKSLDKKITILDAIGDLEKINGEYACPDSTRKFKNGKYGVAKSDYQKLMRLNVVNEPNSHRYANHTRKIVEMHEKMLKTIEKGKRITPADNLVDGLKRRGVTILDSDGTSPTVTSHPDDFIHYKEPRILSVREMARLQSFPDWYEFKGKYTTGGKQRKTDVPRYTQVGNAVPPLFAEQIGLVFKEIMKNEI